ncbi:MAG: shikimate dehydrogenase [Pseudomonadota bacterium]
MIKAGVIGHPIKQSKSPMIHGHWLGEHGIDGSYEAIDLAPDAFVQSVRDLQADGYAGCNITVPHKEAAFALCDDLTERAKIIGAVNTLVFRDDRIQGDNTDCEGFLANLMADAPHWNAATGPALVLGAGGAARGIVFALLDSGVPEIILANRTRGRAEALAADFAQVHVCDWADAEHAVGSVDLIVNTTALGMVGQPELILPLDALRPSTVVTDIVYNPLETELLKTARAKGSIGVDGLGMLLHQAVPGFEAWFGTRPIVTDALRKKIEAAL